MNENNDTATENRLQTIYAEGEAHVEGFQIKPLVVADDELRMHAQMRIVGGEAIYYVAATVTFSEDDAGHHVQVFDRREELVDEFTTEIVTVSPEDTVEATDALYETYHDAAEAWYTYARNADTAGETA